MAEPSEQNPDLAYDLRTIYANEIVGEHLRDIAQARKADNFPVLFEALKDLRVVINHKFKPGDKKKGKKSDQEKYFELMGRIVELANRFPNDWLGTTRTAQGKAELEAALHEVEMFFYKVMDNANMFGSKRDMEGLI